jgi:hypothetical protein
MLGRAKWHILQKHSVSAVKYGTLSTLRQSLSALLDIDMSFSEEDINMFMDNNCYWEWEYTDNSKIEETNALRSNDKCYPLNIQENLTVGKDIIKRSSEQSDLINIQQMFLSGASQMIYDERMRMVLYNYVPNTRSKEALIQAMKENLELVPHKNITSFSFSINKTYEKSIIGEGYASAGTYSLLPSFIGLSKSQAAARAESLGLNYEFVGDGDTVIDQSYPEKKRIDKIGKNKLVLTLNTKEVKKEDTEDDEDVEDEDTPSGDTSTDTPSTDTPSTETPSTDATE